VTSAINRLLGRLGNRPGQAAHGQSWRRVPRINVLPRAGAATDRRRLTRYALAAIVLIAVVYLVMQYQGRSADEAAAEALRSDLQRVQADVAAEQQVVTELQASVDEARQRLADAKAGYEQITAGRTDWFTGISSLLASGVEGVRFTSIVTKTGGEIALTGEAADLGAISAFQGRLRDVSGSLKLQGISFESTSTVLKFAANLRVVQ
jgi:Tfp pilus assembly protein PilN